MPDPGTRKPKAAKRPVGRTAPKKRKLPKPKAVKKSNMAGRKKTTINQRGKKSESVARARERDRARRRSQWSPNAAKAKNVGVRGKNTGYNQAQGNAPAIPSTRTRKRSTNSVYGQKRTGPSKGRISRVKPGNRRPASR